MLRCQAQARDGFATCRARAAGRARRSARPSPRAVKRRSKTCAHRARGRSASTSRVAATASSSLVDDAPGHAFVDHLGHRAAAPRDHRRAAGHRLDHHEAERLGPVDREQQRRARCRGTRASRASPISPTNSTSAARRSSGSIARSKYALSGRVDLRGDLQRHARRGARSRSRGRRASPARCGRGRRDSRRAASALNGHSVCRHAVVHGAEPVRVAQRLALVVGDRHQRELRASADRRPAGP